MYEYEDYIEHHGIRGQKWGIRRFQNPDGTRTAAGKRRERDSYDDSSNSSARAQNDHSNLKKGLAIAGTMALGAALIANPSSRNVITKYGKTAISNLPDVAYKAGHAIGKGAAKAGDKFKKRADRLGDAMFDAAIASVGSIAISKLAKKLDPGPNATEAEKNISKVATDTASAGIRTMTNGNYGGGNNNKGGGQGGGVKSTREYQDLFNGLNSSDDRQRIKDAANNGATIEELQKLRDSMGHSEIDLSQYMDYVIGW